MSEFFKDKYRMIAFFTAFLLVITAVSGVVAYSRQDKLVETPDPIEESSQEEPQEEEPQDEPVVTQIEPQLPSTMRGVFITPGIDFLVGEDHAEQTVKTQIDEALEHAKDLTMNSIIVNTSYEDKVIYHTQDAEKVFGGFDVMEYTVNKAREYDFFVFGVFDVSQYKPALSTAPLAVGAGSPDQLVQNLGEYARKYQLDGILLEGYVNQATQDSYNTYSKIGGAIGFDNYMRQTPEMLIQNAARVINTETPVTQIGILADPVWANQEQEDEGSATAASFSALTDGNADTRAFVENGLVDFIAVNAYGATSDTSIPFDEVVTWWADLAHGAHVPLYIVQAVSKVATDATGWASADELVVQSKQLEEITGVRGSIFDSLQRLLDNPDDVSTKLLGYYKDEVQVEEELILQELEMTKPEQTSYTTNEQQVVFTGASDPEEPLTINDTPIRTDGSGYFTVAFDLSAGSNTFVIKHKEKSVTYNITREIDILTEMSPTGNITTDGGMEISISAVAYQDAVVTASVNGAQVPLSVDDNVVDEGVRDSTYRTFSGTYNAPAATENEQSLGAVTVTASWNGESKTLTGGSVTVNKKAKIEDGVPVVVSVPQAKTYPPTTLDNIPSANYYPLPQGAMDYAVGEEIFYKDVGYTVLASGLRVRTSDITHSSDYASGNAISGVSVDVADGYTYVRLKTTQKISYNFAYGGDNISIRMNNTNTVPANMDLTQNPLFTSANWNENTLVLSLVKVGGFMGYRGYYDGEDLVFQFNNPPSSLAGARIVVDPGHGGKDTGALGFLSDYPEKALNASIADLVAQELQTRGANVLLLDTSGGMDLGTRVSSAEQFGADLLISVHNNTASNASAHGTEVYYFNPYSKAFAASASSTVSGQLGTNNRGARQSYYHITLSSQFPSMLVECGFMSNRDEYEKLIRTKYQERIAVGIVDAAANGIASAYTGISGGGSENTGGSIEVEGSGESSAAPEVEVKPGTSAVTGVTLSRSTLQLRPERNGMLNAEVQPADAANKNVSWKSSDTSVARVDSSGRVTGVSAGKATVTVTTAEGNFTASCTVTVLDSGSTAPGGSDIPVDDAYLSDDTLSLAVKENKQLTITLVPNNATNKEVSWRTSNPAIATVNATGLVTGVKAGEATITATTEDGGIISSCYVTVGGESSSSESGDQGNDDLSKVDWIYLSASNTTMYIRSNTTLSVYSSQDKPIRNNNFNWKSSDTGIATVDRNGNVTAGGKEGTAIITAYSARYGDLYDSITISVSRQRTRVTGVSLNQSSLEMQVGTNSSALKATVSPSDATNKSVSWRTSTPSVATVDQNGVITAKGVGSTTVIVSTQEGQFVATCNLTVVQQVELFDMWFDMPEIEMWVGETDDLTFFLEFDPQNIADKAVTWRSSDPSVVSVDSNGNIKALANGTARIVATYNGNRNFSATMTIRVQD